VPHQACVAQYKGWTYPWSTCTPVWPLTPAIHVLQCRTSTAIRSRAGASAGQLGSAMAAHPISRRRPRRVRRAVVTAALLARRAMASRDPAGGADATTINERSRR